MSTLPEITPDVSRLDLERIMLELSNYDDPEDLARARRYRTACRAYLNLPIEEFGQDGTTTRMKLDEVRENYRRADFLVTRLEFEACPPRQFVPSPNWRD